MRYVNSARFALALPFFFVAAVLAGIGYLLGGKTMQDGPEWPIGRTHL